MNVINARTELVPPPRTPSRLAGHRSQPAAGPFPLKTALFRAGGAFFRLGGAIPDAVGCSTGFAGKTPDVSWATPREKVWNPEPGGKTPPVSWNTPARGGATPADSWSTPDVSWATPREMVWNPRRSWATPLRGGNTPEGGRNTPATSWNTPEVAVVALRPLRPRSAGGLRTSSWGGHAPTFHCAALRGATRRSATSSTSRVGRGFMSGGRP